MQRINMHDAKTNLSRLVSGLAEGGGDVFICRAGQPVARLSPVTAMPGTIRPGLLQGQIWLADDFDATSAREAALFGIPR